MMHKHACVSILLLMIGCAHEKQVCPPAPPCPACQAAPAPAPLATVDSPPKPRGIPEKPEPDPNEEIRRHAQLEARFQADDVDPNAKTLEDEILKRIERVTKNRRMKTSFKLAGVACKRTSCKIEIDYPAIHAEREGGFLVGPSGVLTDGTLEPAHITYVQATPSNLRGTYYMFRKGASEPIP